MEIKNNGFTLVELLATLAVVATLAIVAVPSFQGVLVSNRLASDYNEVLSGLYYARGEAVKRREKVAFEVTVSSPWEYKVYQYDGKDNPLLIRLGQSKSVSWNNARVVFDSLGRSNCDSSCELTIGHGSSGCYKKIHVNKSGRVSRSSCNGDAS